ncbi:glycosyl transferase family 2, partial [Burkholderia gladioli]
GAPCAALGCAVVWAAVTAQFCARRLRGAALTPAHVAEMVVTSILIPPVSLYWRLRGAIHFKVPFV